MNREQTLKLYLELIWWGITAVLVALVLYPIYAEMRVWPFVYWNVAFVIVAITLSRYMFQLPHSFIAYRQYLKATLFILMIPLTVVMIGGVNHFMTYVEDYTWDGMTGHLPATRKRAIESYLWSEMLFFGTASFITPPIFAVRLAVSIWRTHNLGKA